MTNVGTTSECSYTPAEIDWIARETCETVVAEPGKTCPYDVEAFERIERRAVPTGQYPLYDPPPHPCDSLPTDLPPDCIAQQPYHLRIGGFRREQNFGPDEGAAQLASAGVAFSDSLGHGLFEHLLLCRKYGVVPVFEAPAVGFPMPFLQSELSTFEEIYRREIAEFAGWIRRAEAIYEHPILERAGQPWTLWSSYSPLALFMLSAGRKPEETATELEAECGTRRLDPAPSNPRERAAQLRALSFIRERHMEVRAIMASILREVIAPDAILIDNAHTLPGLDYERLGEIYDHPGVAARSGYLEDESSREANVAFSVRLFGDLAGKPPIASVRINLTAAGARVVAGPQAVRNWSSAALRHGVSGLYFWPIDYPSDDGQYFGPMPGNTDPSAQGRQRWDAMLGVFRDLQNVRCFQPPRGKIGILVPYDHLELAGWRRIFDTFVRLENEHILCRLVSGRAVSRGEESLSGLELLLVPACPFAADSLVESLERFVHRGGTLVCGCGEGLRYNTDGNLRTMFGGAELDSLLGERPKSHKMGQGKAIFTDDIFANLQQCDVDRQEWIYSVGAENLKHLSGTVEGRSSPPPEPDINVKHYLYEHSSNAFMPHLKKVEDFPTS